MKSTDVISLVAVTSHNHVWLGYVPMELASSLIRWWKGLREKVATGTEDERAKAADTLSKGTLGLHAGVEDSEEPLLAAAVGLEHVVGMYMEFRQSPQERIAKMMEKGMSGDLPGDEWKKGGE